MDAVGLIASLALGLSFVVAGASKLAAGPAWPEQAAGLGAPTWTVPIVPWFELIVGALLIAQVGRRPAAVVAGLLLVAFTVLIVSTLRQGRRPPCACFGAWSAKPIGPGHVARNTLLLCLAILAAL
ncbi:MAG: DoxX family protein [Ilumatobacter sp.]|uniref:MauE/DoxX family redox-associated membrane protein n=1 Tax=Ilumatobacter sp. TaxID=1967498 RepID=UPI003C7904A8